VMQRTASVVTYTVAFPGTGFGSSIAMQVATDLNPLATTFDLTLDGDLYEHSVWQGFYASVAGGVDPAVARVVRKLADVRRAAREQDPSEDIEHRLVVAGYSLGATQALLMAMMLCSDTMQAAAAMGVRMSSFASRVIMLFAMPNASRGGDTCAYVERMCAARGLQLYALCDPLDIVTHFYSALPLSRPIVPYVHVLEASGVYKLNAASVTSGALYGALARVVSWSPWRIVHGARFFVRALSASFATHMLGSYERKLELIRSGEQCECTG
jgi:hypothetical protein